MSSAAGPITAMRASRGESGSRSPSFLSRTIDCRATRRRERAECRRLIDGDAASASTNGPLEQAERDLHLQHAPHGAVDERDRDRVRCLDSAAERLAGAVELRQIDVQPRPPRRHAAGGALVGGDADGTMHEQHRRCSSPATTTPSKPSSPRSRSSRIAREPPHGRPSTRCVRVHDRREAGFADRRRERLGVDLAQLARADVHRRVVHAALGQRRSRGSACRSRRRRWRSRRPARRARRRRPARAEVRDPRRRSPRRAPSADRGRRRAPARACCRAPTRDHLGADHRGRPRRPAPGPRCWRARSPAGTASRRGRMKPAVALLVHDRRDAEARLARRGSAGSR